MQNITWKAWHIWGEIFWKIRLLKDCFFNLKICTFIIFSMCQCVIKSTDLRTIFSPHAMKTQSDINLTSECSLLRRMRQQDVESVPFCHVGNDRLGWQQGVCYASSKRSAAEAWVGLEPVKLQWDPTSLPTPSSLHLSAVYLLAATPPFAIFCLCVSVEVTLFTTRRHTKRKYQHVRPCPRSPQISETHWTEMRVWCFESISGIPSKADFQNGSREWMCPTVRTHRGVWMCCTLNSTEYRRVKDCQPSDLNFICVFGENVAIFGLLICRSDKKRWLS